MENLGGISTVILLTKAAPSRHGAGTMLASLGYCVGVGT